MATTPSKCQLSEWGLPPLIIAWFRNKGITSLFEWQVECLCKNNVLFGENLVYSAPTSAGKTLVADFLLIKKVLEYGKKALVIEPFVALTREKAAALKSMLYTTNVRVGAFGGNYYTPGGMASVKVAVCTIEKANNFVNKLINENKLSDIGIIVVDEIHYLGDEKRGHQLELLLTKVLYYNSLQDKDKRIQIVGLSATIPNLESIAKWLKASLYVTEFRPVPLIEKIKISNKIYEVKSLLQDPTCAPIEVIDPEKIVIEKDYDDLCYICIESIISGHSTLVFCESKRECEIMAGNLADQIKLTGNKLKSKISAQANVSKGLRDNLSRDKILKVLDKLKKCPAGPDKELVKSLSFGVAFHHAGLTTEEREIIEDGFKSGAIKALMATSTLSSGVNLPARRVIIRSPTMFNSNGGVYQKEMLNPTTYRQMIGRAGRKNIDTCGESILICRPENQDIAINLIKASLGQISSSLAHRMMADGEPSGLKKAVLEVIANNTAKTRVHLNQYLESTFWLASASATISDEFKQAIKDTLCYLVTKKFIEELKPGVYRSTRLGNAVLASGLHPDEGLELLQDLIKARQGFCLLNDLHIIYQVTPNDISRAVDLRDWQHYSKVWNELDEIGQFVGERVGIDEITIMRRCQGFMGTLCEEKERVYRRFWIALVINDLVSEMALPKICQKYRISKAVVQQAQRAVAQFAGVISIFCKELGYDNIAALVTPLETRINFSCQRDLLELIKLNITRPIARQLFNAGYNNSVALAKADRLDIEFIIRQIKPFKKDASFNLKSESSPSMWVPELAKNMTTLDYASHIVDTAISFVAIEYDIDLTTTSVKRKDDEASTSDSGTGTNNSTPTDRQKAPKRGRLDNEHLGTEPLQTNNPPPSSESHVVATEVDDMVRANKDVPNFVVHNVGSDLREVNKFMDKWIVHSSISLNFKIAQQVNEPIGAKIKKKTTRRRRSRGGSDGSQEDDGQNPSTSSQEEGLPLRLEIDNQKHIITRLYACFDDDLTVYIIDNHTAFTHIRSNLADFLNNSYSSSTARTATQRKQDFIPIKLYTQNIVLTYKVLYAAFGLSQSILDRHFEWNSFDVAWWMVNNCPNRGFNNCNSSLSLVAKTKWVKKYHHFLYPNSRKSSTTRSAGKSREDILKLKDIVKSGKTAILKPLIDEIVVELGKRNQTKAYMEAEILSRIAMAQMMVHGIGLDMKTMRDELSLYEDLMQQLTDIAQKFYAKSTISLTNIRHVARVLYEDLDLKKHLLDHGTVTDITKDSTNSEILTILSQYHPFPRLVQDFRKIAKALDALQSVNTHARYNSELDMMRVFGHCDFWQLTAHGNRQEENIECVPRKCFVPSPGWVLVAADYSQLELRLLAHFSNDTNLLEILNRRPESDGDFDVFKVVASKMYQKPVEEITGENRQHAKQICYGIIYGMGNTTLSNRLGVDLDRAEDFRQDFFSAFPRILAYTEELIKECEQVGYVESLLGRRRVIEGINSDSSSSRAKAHRVAINTRIQSSASDIIKLAMQMVNQYIVEHHEKNARLVLEMHDELIYEVNPVISINFAKNLKFLMESMTTSEDLRVKLLVNLKEGTNWSKLEDFITETKK